MREVAALVLLIALWILAIPALYGVPVPLGLGEKLPLWVGRARADGSTTSPWLGLVFLIGLSYFSALFLAGLTVFLTRRAARPAHRSGDIVLIEAGRRPLRILLASLIFRESSRPLHLTASALSTIQLVTFTLIVFTLAWFAIRAFRVAVDWASERLPAEPDHEIRHRVLRTQLTLLLPIATAVIVVVAAGAVLMQFSFVRNVGLSLLASAGLVGVIFGLAAQKPLAGLIGGIQLSITQPIRIGDTVFIEKELGTIERITLTYVVVRLREQRMLVIPVSRFLDAPFENWTLASPDVIGSVLISVDFTTPVDAVRTRLREACTNHEGWDQKTCSLEVIEATERTMTLRALVSSANPSNNWALRCAVRENLVEFLSGLDGGVHLPQDRSSELGKSNALSST